MIEMSPKNHINLLFPHSFLITIENTSTVDEIDWIMKYFILISIVMNPSFFLYFINVQKDRVFSSKATQTVIQVFLSVQRRGVINRINSIELFVLISNSSNCKFDLTGDYNKICSCFLCFEDI